jgi:lipopolysaccharide/colanic/teichoic acid biosynthesis glycosyltransferase
MRIGVGAAGGHPGRGTAGGAVAPPHAKRAFDLAVGAMLLVPTILAAALLLVLNPFFNRGPLLFVQKRMGKDCRPFRVLKFRTMTAVPRTRRRADDPLEEARITPLGGLLRRMRIDELPQVINVLRGEMSLIGPRPDYFPHALHYARSVPGYRARHAVRPGITGLAQVDLGYVEGTDATRAKVAADLRYVEEGGLAMEAWIVLRTLAVILGLGGR